MKPIALAKLRLNFNITLIFQVILVLSASQVFAQAGNTGKLKLDFVYRAWNNMNGLPQNTVFDVHKDNFGNIWGATEEGIFRFDGSKFSVFNKQNTSGISNNLFYAIVENEEHVYVAGYQTLAKISKRVEKTWDVSGIIQNAQIRALEFDAEGNLWAGTSSGHVFYMKDDSIYSDGIPHSIFNGSIEKLHWYNGNMYVGTSQGLYVTDKPYGSIKELYAFKGKSITDIEPDSTGNIWVATSNSGLFKMGEDTINYTRINGLRENQINCLGFYRGSLWIGLASSGFQIMKDTGFYYPIQEKLLNQGVRSIHTDENGMVWLGTNSAGLILVSEAVIKSTPPSFELSKKVILGIYEDEFEGKWVGTVGHGVYNLVGDTKFQVNQASGLSNNIVLSITGKGDDIYVGTHMGLNKIDRKTRVVDKSFHPGYQLESKSITVLFKDAEGWIWIGTREAGLYYIDDTGVLKKAVLPESFVRISLIAAAEDKKGIVYFGTRGGGIISVDKNQPSLKIIHHSDFPSDVVYTIFTDSEGTLWASGNKGFVVNYNGGYKVFDNQSGLNFSAAYRALKDSEGYIWLSGNTGLQRIYESDLLLAKNTSNVSKFKFRVKMFTNFDGMPNAETNGGFYPAGWKMSDGTLWYPTVEGVAIVNDQLIPKLTDTLKVQITSLKVGNYEYFPEEKISLPPGVFNFEISYTCYEYLSPDDIEYYIRLKGENKWEAMGNRNIAYFSNLKNGNYIFEVKAVRYGIWSETVELKFKVEPYFYETLWFKILMGLFFASLLILFLYIQKRINIHKLNEQQMITRAQLYGQEKERQYISTELHDSISQQLATAKIFLEIAGTDEQKRQELTNKSAGVIKSVMNEIRALSHSLTPPGLKDIGLKEALEDLFNPYKDANKFKIHFEYSFPDDAINEELKFNLFRIAQEQIQNIDRYSNAVNAWIIFSTDDEGLVISFTDDGKGSQASEINYGLGFSNIKNRLSLFGGTMEINTSPGNGFQLLIQIPLKISVLSSSLKK